MPTSYTTTVTVDGFASANYGSQLDSLEIISGSTNPYELPQPPSARASFLGLPVVSGVTQTPDWWIGKEVTFTIAPQGATGTVTWTGIVQGYNCSPVQTSSTDQIIELDLLGQTSRLSTEIMTDITMGEAIPGLGYNYWSNFIIVLNSQLASVTWDEAPNGLTWDGATGTWDTYTNNKVGLTFAKDNIPAGDSMFSGLIPCAGQDMLSFITSTWSMKNNGWLWFDDTTITLNSPASYTNYTQITSLNAQSCVLWESLNSSQSFSNIINSASCTDGQSTPVTYDYLDATSYDAYGYRYVDFGVSYEASSVALDALIANKVKAYKQPNTYLQSFTVNLDELTHVTGEWQNFYKSTKPVRLPLTNIPAAYGGNHTYMVRGVQLNLTRRHAEATLLVVPSTIYNPA